MQQKTESLKKGEAVRSPMADYSDSAIAYLDIDFNFIDVNQLYAEGCRRNREELIGKNHFELFPNEENLNIFKMVRDSGQPVEYHAKPFTYADQPERGVTYWDWTLKPVKEKDGPVTGLVLTLREVTEKYKIWKQSRKSALKLMFLMALTIFASDFLIMLVFKYFDDAESIDFLVLDPFVLACLLLPIIYFFYLHPLINSLANTKQTKRSLLQSFDKLESERKRLFSILDELPASVHLLRPDHTIVYANRYFKDIFGFKPETPCYKLLHSRDEPCPVCHAFQTFEAGIGGETEELHTNGHIYRLFNYPFRDIDGSDLVLQLAIDLTQQKAYEKRLIQTEKLLTVAEMSAMISHEFRNSLTSVKMILELQCESKNLSAREKDSLSVVLSSIGHMEEIVSHLINFSQPRERKFAFDNLNSLVEECIDFTDMHFKKHKIALKMDLSPSIPDLFLDRQAIKEAMINLILNAIQAIAARENGTEERKVLIKTELYTLPVKLQKKISGNLVDFPIEIPNEAEKEGLAEEPVFNEGETCVLVTVRDNGIGIRETELDNIFNPFYTDKKQGGTGLGLSMVKRNILAHRGIVTAESEAGQGAVFKIYLPLAAKEMMKEIQ